MTVDLMVYGRGQDRLEGYQLFAQPPYWTEQMLMTLDAFNELWTSGDLRDSQKNAFASGCDPWGRTYMFICMPPPYCCALLRCTRVEGDEPGTWLKEVRNFDIWSMEGICCPYEQRENFFAMLPSIICWLESDNSSFYGKLRLGAIGKTVEIPEKYVFNPYSEESPPDELLELFHTEEARNAWYELYHKIYLSQQPFQFLFGPLADYFASQIGGYYGMQEVFSTICKNAREASVLNDPFTQMGTITLHSPEREIHTYSLRLWINCNRKDGNHRRWGIFEPNRSEYNDDRYESRWQPFSSELAVLDIMAESESIRNYAKRMRWIVSESSEIHQKYTFIKED